jgi:hypothetical protein
LIVKDCNRQMATENKGVMVYLPKEVEEYITEFCTEYSITRKDKEGNILPSLGTGIVTYLKSKMSGESPSDVLAKPKSLGNGLTKDEVIDLIREYSTSDAPSNGLTREEVLDLINESNTNRLPSDGLTRNEVLDLIDEYFTGHTSSNGLTRDEVLDLIDSHIPSNSPTRKTPEALDLSTATEAGWGVFHQAVGLESSTSKKSVELANAAIAVAVEKGFTGWTFSGKKQRFYRDSL